MTLRYSLEKRMAGNVCAADGAFHALQREMAMLGSRDTWTWFADRFRVLETALSDAGGFDENLAEHLESPYGFMGSQEVVDRHFLTEGICVEMEDVVGAFFVALQPRLNAVKVAAKRVYFAATNIDAGWSRPARVGSLQIEVLELLSSRIQGRYPRLTRQGSTPKPMAKAALVPSCAVIR